MLFPIPIHLAQLHNYEEVEEEEAWHDSVYGAENTFEPVKTKSKLKSVL